MSSNNTEHQLRLLLWRILIGWQKVHIISHSTDEVTTWMTRITKWQKLKMDYHLKQIHRKDWIWWNNDQYSKEITI